MVSSKPNADSFGGFLEDFRRTVDVATARLQQMSSNDQSKNGGWSRQEILGHLIDSAANNHQRFVRAQFTDDLRFPGYEQDNWVSSQSYATEPWDNLVQLWTAYNRHLIHFLGAVSTQALTKLRTDHNLDKLAFKSVPASKPTTLEYFVRDYVDHLRHHLNQIFAE